MLHSKVVVHKWRIIPKEWRIKANKITQTRIYYICPGDREEVYDLGLGKREHWQNRTNRCNASEREEPIVSLFTFASSFNTSEARACLQ